MGLFKSLKGKGPDYIGGDQHNQQISGEKKTFLGHSSGSDQVYEPPPGPPPGHREEEYAAPPGPPPGHRDHEKSNPPPYHDWESAVPDLSSLPPPPVLRHENSTNNCSEDEAILAHEWVARNPLYTPVDPPQGAYNAVQNSDINLIQPREVNGQVKKLKTGVWKVTTRGTRDAIVLTNLPIYFASKDSPLQTEIPKSIYYEIRIAKFGAGDSMLSMGYAAQPYPTWRHPGHERASLAVHGDDGRRFINDSYGGIDFTQPFREGETLGIGMTFSPNSSSSGTDVDIWFTRDGRKVGSWDLYEQRDEAAGPIDGLEGRWDLYGAIGLCGSVEFEVSFAPGSWMYQPRGQ